MFAANEKDGNITGFIWGVTNTKFGTSTCQVQD